MRRSMMGPNQAADWATAYQWVKLKRCWEHQRTGSCSCCNKHGNPCDFTDRVLEDLDAMSMGGNPINNTLEGIIDWIMQRTCRAYPQCNHKACQEATPIIEFLQNQQIGKAA